MLTACSAATQWSQCLRARLLAAKPRGFARDEKRDEKRDAEALAERPIGLVSHSIGIDSLRAEAEGWALALALLQDVELAGLSERWRGRPECSFLGGLEFDTIICNAAINACAGSGQWEAGLALMARM